MSTVAVSAASACLICGISPPGLRTFQCVQSSGTFAQLDLGVVAVEPLLFRRECRGLRRAAGAHLLVTRLDRCGIIRLVKLFLAPREPLHPRRAGLAHSHET